MNTDQQQHLLGQNQVAPNEDQEARQNNVDHDSQEDEDSIEENDEDIGDEDYDPDIRDDILRPASTRSKIVVNLKETDVQKKKKQFGRKDPIIYELDPYDKVRMKLIFPQQKLYKAYEDTKHKLETELKY